jgi:hypothetical protein
MTIVLCSYAGQILTYSLSLGYRTLILSEIVIVVIRSTYFVLMCNRALG